MDLLKRLLAKLRGALTWQLVRGVGELQILTRASYATLAVVPLLVGAWPGVRVLINNHNQVLERSTEELAAAGDRLSQHTRTLAEAVGRATAPLADVDATTAANRAMQAFAEHVDALSREVNQELAALRRQATLSPWLPSSWALGFFAALAVAIGHLIYQGRAPEIARKNTRNGYVKQQRDAFREQPYSDEFSAAYDKVRTVNWEKNKILVVSEEPLEKKMLSVQDTIFHRDDALVFFVAVSELLEELLGRLIERSRTAEAIGEGHERSITSDELMQGDEQLINTIRPNTRITGPYECYRLVRFFSEELHRRGLGLNTEIVRASGAKQNVQDLLRELFGPEYLEASQDTELKLKLDVVGEAARLDYDQASSQRMPAMLAALALYSTAAVIVLVLVGRQTVAVMQAVGWI